MILSILTFVIAIIILFVFCHKNKIIYPLIIKFVGIIATFFSALEYIVKVSVYSPKIGFDYNIYLLLFNIKLNISALALVGILGVSMIMASSVALICTWKKDKNVYFLLIPIIFVFLLNATDFIEILYLGILNSGFMLNFAESIVKAVQMFCVLILGAFMLLPYISLVKNYRNSNVFNKKKDILISGIIWFVLDLSYILIVIVCKLNYYMFYMLDARKFPIQIVAPNGNSVIFSFAISIFVTIFVIVFIFIYILSQSRFSSNGNVKICAVEKSPKSEIYAISNLFF